MEALFSLIRFALWGAPYPTFPAAAFPADAEGWRRLYRESCRQAVQGIVYDAIRKLHLDPLLPEDLASKWAEAVSDIESHNSHLAQVSALQTRAWERRGVDAVELKGLTVAAFYPVPEHRASGDIDWWFPTVDDWDKALRAVEENGLAPEYDGDGDFHYLLGGVVVEHHRNGLEVPGAAGQLLLQSKHILHHAMGAGVGLRHICDIALTYDALEGQYDRREYLDLLSARGLSSWTRCLENVVLFLKGESELSFWGGRLLGLVMADGNFGLHKRRRFSGFLLRMLFFIPIAPRPFIRHWIHLLRHFFCHSILK